MRLLGVVHGNDAGQAVLHIANVPLDDQQGVLVEQRLLAGMAVPVILEIGQLLLQQRQATWSHENWMRALRPLRQFRDWIFVFLDESATHPAHSLPLLFRVALFQDKVKGYPPEIKSLNRQIFFGDGGGSHDRGTLSFGEAIGPWGGTYLAA